MPRFSHDDPAYRAALREMSLRLNRLMDDRGWSRADLTRAAAKHMQEGGRFGPDNTSNFVNGKRKPTKPFIRAMAAAFGVEEEAFMPSFLIDRPGENVPQTPILTEIPGEKGFFRVFVDRKLPLKEALKIVEVIHGVEAELRKDDKEPKEGEVKFVRGAGFERNGDNHAS